MYSGFRKKKKILQNFKINDLWKSFINFDYFLKYAINTFIIKICSMSDYTIEIIAMFA